ncbi:Hpt domain-containing protein, partial [Segeticoccus rhizosphaerae]|uniref:Hpt domain-containing protein n=1 Tax=Segeticoccus rhizosphaerae TaxID=1104777 RepID=UPI001265AA92
MAFHQGPFLAALGAASGDDPALLAELRSAFLESVERQLDLLQRARCDGNWRVAAERLHTIAGSFHVEELRILAQEALDSAPGEPTVIASLG